MNDIVFERGSTWRRWDFHVHTPYSSLNNNFGFTPTDDGSDVKQFDEYVKQLFSKAVALNISAIGITDYFTIEGYKRIRQEYLSNPIKMADLFPDESVRAAISKIFVFPNIEFRLNKFVGEKSHAINYHVLFSDKVDPADIEMLFLEELKIHDAEDGHETNYPLKRTYVEKIGRDYKKYNPTTGSDYTVGLKHITVDDSQICSVLNDIKVPNSIKGNFLITIPVDEDLSQIKWDGRDYHTRKIYYHQCDFLLTANPKTRNWALAEGREQEQIEEFGSIKACIWGSDAHSIEELFRPHEDRYCWIKAEPTFEGLLQIKYEPSQRVSIQKDRPEEKNPHQIIDSITFHDSRFQERPIYLNESLTAIIGGKSTGKSILLRHIAKGADPKQVSERERKLHRESRPLDANAEVRWRDGIQEERKIIYIPQSWLNTIIDTNAAGSDLNKLIREIILQNDSLITAYSELEADVKNIQEEISHSILDYINAINSISECRREIQKTGGSSAYYNTIRNLEEKRRALSSSAGISEDDLQKYNALGEKIRETQDKLSGLDNEYTAIIDSIDPFAILPSFTKVNRQWNHYNDFSSIPTVKDIIEKAAQEMDEAVLQIWRRESTVALSRLTEKKNELSTSVQDLSTEYSPLKLRVANNEETQKIDATLQVEKGNLRRALLVEKTQRDSSENAIALRNQIIKLRGMVKEKYSQYVKIASKVSSGSSTLSFKAEVRENKEGLLNALTGMFDNRNFRPFRDKYEYDLLDREAFLHQDSILDDRFFLAVWDAIMDGTLTFKGGVTFKTALERLFSDWFFVHYSVSSGGDPINQMSPGKKAMVLLEMLVSLENSKCPILIDQPEDDLDNRSIMKDLVAYLRKKKQERQIIVVTHNANVVVLADAEEVIIANQDGNEAKNESKQFEYRCGAIETTRPVLLDDGSVKPGILNKTGIQEQICDILEGGKEAFKQRRSKYFSV